MISWEDYGDQQALKTSCTQSTRYMYQVPHAYGTDFGWYHFPIPIHWVTWGDRQVLASNSDDISNYLQDFYKYKVQFYQELSIRWALCTADIIPDYEFKMWCHTDATTLCMIAAKTGKWVSLVRSMTYTYVTLTLYVPGTWLQPHTLSIKEKTSTMRKKANGKTWLHYTKRTEHWKLEVDEIYLPSVQVRSSKCHGNKDIA